MAELCSSERSVSGNRSVTYEIFFKDGMAMGIPLSEELANIRVDDLNEKYSL
jgi:hypothetical protein